MANLSGNNASFAVLKLQLAEGVLTFSPPNHILVRPRLVGRLSFGSLYDVVLAEEFIVHIGIIELQDSGR